MKFSIKPLTEYELVDLSLFLSKNYFGNETSAYWLSRFTAWWIDNPYHFDYHDKGWIIKRENKIYGFLGCFTTALNSGQGQIEVNNIGSWCISKEARNYSLELFKRIINSTSNQIHFCTTGTDQVVEILQQFNFNSYVQGQRLMSGIIPLDYLSLACFKVFKKGIKIPIITDVSRYFTQLVTKPKKLSVKPSFTIRKLSHSDKSQLDRFNESIKNISELTLQRNFKFFQWYVFNDTNFDKIALGVFKDNQLVSTSIFTILDREIKVLECLDFIVNSEIEYSESIKIKKQHLITIANEYKCDLISFPEYTGFIDSTLKSVDRGRNNKLYFMLDKGKLDLSKSYLTCQGDIYI
jgi:hypothetical protein